MTKRLLVYLILFLIPCISSNAQYDEGEVLEASVFDDDLEVGGDIFSDFNEDLETAKVAEFERYYRYGRFFSFNLGLGVTMFDGNRGYAYENQLPSYSLSFTFFQNFRVAYGLGVAFSKHHMFLPDPTRGHTPVGGSTGPGFVDVSMLRTFFSSRYYLDTADLGTAITYSNPYVIGRIEYWYLTNKFIDQSETPDDSGGGLGFGLGCGLEFPIKLKESFLGVELLFHTVNFHDKFTNAYQARNDGEFGYEDMSGNAWSTTINYIISW